MCQEEMESIHTVSEGAVQRAPQQGNLTRSWKRKCGIVLYQLFPYYMEENLALSSASSWSLILWDGQGLCDGWGQLLPFLSLYS